jgi:hypothetical protein
MTFDLTEINLLVEQGYVMKQKHPVHPLWIYNYTNACQWAKCWNPITLQCRGLVLDEEGIVIARSFPKFFNYEELTPEQIPINEPYIITMKMDGSLILAFKYKGEFIVASRGSFMSEQAIKAQSLFTDRQKELLPEGITAIFEIIYPENRIVVNYGDTTELVLLGIIRSEDGAEKDYGSVFVGGSIMGFKVVKLISQIDFLTLRNQIPDDEEGYVINFYESRFRMKIKGAEYCRLHRVMTEISSRDVWEYLANDLPFDQLLDKTPDEWNDWLQRTINELKNNYFEVEETSIIEHVYKLNEAKSLVPDFEENQKQLKKVFAALIKDHPYKHIIFRIYSNMEYSKEIWKLIYPKRELPFKNAE